MPLDPFALDAGDWKYLTSYRNHEINKTIYVYGYTRDMVKIADGNVRMWFKFIPVDVEKIEGPPAPRDWSYSVFHQEVDCKKGATRTLVIRHYNWRGEVITETEKPAEWSPVAPDTVGYQQYSAACEAPQKMADDAWALLKEFLGTLSQASEGEAETSP